MAKLRLRAKPGLLHVHLQREEAGTRAFVGYKHGVVAKGPAEDGSQDVFGFVPTDEVVELPVDKHTVEYAKAVADGDLLAVDEATAAICRQYTGRVIRVASATQEPAPTMSASSTAAQKG